MEISPAATDDEMAAIAAAIEALWPKPQVAADRGDLNQKAAAWRFSRRPWATTDRRWNRG